MRVPDASQVPVGLPQRAVPEYKSPGLVEVVSPDFCNQQPRRLYATEANGRGSDYAREQEAEAELRRNTARDRRSNVQGCHGVHPAARALRKTGRLRSA
jgi:hypothetical protein